MTMMSSLFPDFTNLFSVGKTISQNANTDPNDVLNTKNALAQTGDYQVPDYGITDIPDMGMIDGLKKFQQKNGLKVDGVMKPGGPTENKISETLAGQDVSTVDPLASNTSKPKPKPTKIDPLTGLPEIKMPKLKKPTNAMWKQAANQQKQNTNPWFKSNKLQPVSDEAHAENTRTMDGMLNYSTNGFLPTLFADAIKSGGDKAISEFANFLNQLSDRKKDRVDDFEQEVIEKLPEQSKQTLWSFQQQEKPEPISQETDGNGSTLMTNQGSSNPADQTAPDGEEEENSQDHSYDDKEAQSDVKASSSGGDLEGAVDDANNEYPGANMRVTSQGRSVRRQAELMASRRMRSRSDFLGTYTNHYYINDMDEWVTNNPDASHSEVSDEFEDIIEEALDAGYKVSNHLEGHAIDVSIPRKHQSEVKSYLEGEGIRVLDEGGAATGAHWHLEFQ
jgi:putative peptidoglycan binding protein